jgi:hypothetical protein
MFAAEALNQYELNFESLDIFRTAMRTEKPKKNGGIPNWILLSVLYALVFGALFTFGDYLRQYMANSSFSRQVSQEFVQADTRPKLLRRFLFGSGAGAVLGFLVGIRGRKKGDDDDDA